MTQKNVQLYHQLYVYNSIVNTTCVQSESCQIGRLQLSLFTGPLTPSKTVFPSFYVSLHAHIAIIVARQTRSSSWRGAAAV